MCSHRHSVAHRRHSIAHCRHSVAPSLWKANAHADLRASSRPLPFFYFIFTKLVLWISAVYMAFRIPKGVTVPQFAGGLHPPLSAALRPELDPPGGSLRPPPCCSFQRGKENFSTWQLAGRRCGMCAQAGQLWAIPVGSEAVQQVCPPATPADGSKASVHMSTASECKRGFISNCI